MRVDVIYRTGNILTFICFTTRLCFIFYSSFVLSTFLSCFTTCQVSARWRRVQGLGQGQGGPGDRRQGGDTDISDIMTPGQHYVRGFTPAIMQFYSRRFDASSAHRIRVLQIPNLAIDTQPGDCWSCDRAVIPGELKWKVLCTGLAPKLWVASSVSQSWARVRSMGLLSEHSFFKLRDRF